MKFIRYIFALFCVSSVYAGPHTIQRGETLADVAKLYNISLDSIIKANPNTEAYVGYTIEVPISTLVYDLGDSELFRNMCYRYTPNYKKGVKKYNTAHEKQLKLNQISEKKRLKVEAEIINDYKEAVAYGNTDALYQLGRQKIHGVLYDTDGYPNFSQTINTNVDEFQKGIEYLQIAALIGKNDKALIELALACGYEDSPIRNPYLCLGMLEQYQKEQELNVNNLICYMYETGYGIHQNLLQAYIYCPSTELTNESGTKTHREKILEKIEAMPTTFESSRYGVGLDSKTMMSVGFSHYHDGKLEPEGIFWLHRAARQNNADANWALASILQNENYIKNSMGDSWNKESQILCFAKNAAKNGKQEAENYLEAYKKQQDAIAEEKRLIRLERQRQREEKKRRRREMWANFANVLVQAAAETYVTVESAKMQGTIPNNNIQMPIAQMSDMQWQARNQLALQQIAQYTMNKCYADWTGTPMIQTDMSAVDLGTDMSPGSPLWCWGMQQQINTISTQNARMSCEIAAYYKRQADQITQQLIDNPLQPIAGYVDRDGNWISREMVEAGYNNPDKTDISSSENRYSGFEDIRAKNEAFYKERYGNKDCPMCHNKGICTTCKGYGYIYNTGGVQGTTECPNCLIINGRASGKCRNCKGTGHVYGLK